MKKQEVRIEKVDPINYPVSGKACETEETKGGTSE
jgi:hypothetical protein